MNTPERGLRLIVENVGDIPILVRVGNGTSAKPDPLMLRGHLALENGDARRIVFGTGFYSVNGDIIPLTIPLRAKAHYEIDTRLTDWSVEDKSRPFPSLSDEILKASALQFELDGFDCFVPHDRRLLANWPDSRFAADMRLAENWGCWQGKLRSNTFRLR